MTATTGAPRRLSLWRRILFRIGIVLTTIMGIFNTVNGGSQLLGIQGEGISPWIGLLLFGVGLPTLLFVSLAWVPIRWALITVIALRAMEALTMWVPFGPGDWYTTPERQPFYLVLVGVSLVVCALMSLGLQRRRSR